MATFFGLLLLGGAAGTIAALSVPDLRARVSPSAHEIAALVAVGATLGSLYFSEFADFLPCEFCWYQRIAMYPLAVILPIAALRRDLSPMPYVRIIASIGLVISLYHVQLQWFPEQSSACDITNPCTGRWVEAFGWMTIPQMAAISFGLIIALTSLSIRSSPQEQT